MSDSQPYVIAGVPLRCRHCGRTQFRHQRVALEQKWQILLDLEWLAESADLFVCSACGCCHQFIAPKENRPELPPAPLEESIECLSCHALIPPRVSRCEQCGWTYQ